MKLCLRRQYQRGVTALELLPLLAAVAVAVALALACGPAPSPLPPGPVPEPDPTPVDDDCQRAETVICKLGCRTALGHPLCEGPTGVRFGARCRDEIRRGVPWDAACLATITSCDQVDAAATGELCADGGAP